MRRGRGGSSRPIRVAGLRLGHGTATGGATGVTVALFHPPASVVVDVRGGASCTYDTASLSVEATFGRRWSLFFAGGSVHGLDAARGIRTALLSQGEGHRPFRNPNRIVQVSGATLFDLPSEEGTVPDYLPLGFEAVRRSSGSRIEVGRVGAGAGATVGKYLGKDRAMPGGLGYASGSYESGGAAGALVVLNSVGAVRDVESGRWLAGARGPRGRLIPPGSHGIPETSVEAGLARGTNLVLVVTEAPLDRGGLYRMAIQAHDGLARAVVPAHTATDGDVVFAASTARLKRPRPEPYAGAIADRIGARVAALVSRAAVVAISA